MVREGWQEQVTVGLSHVKEFGLGPEAGVQKLKGCKQRWHDCFGCSLEHRLQGLAWKSTIFQVRNEEGLQ